MIKKKYLLQFWVVSLFLSIGIVVHYVDQYKIRNSIKNYINAVKSKPSHPVEAIPDLKPVERYDYPEHLKRRSPFGSGKLDTKSMSLHKPDFSRPKEPLEAYPLDAIKFSGVLEEGPRRWALILLPDGKMTRVKIGNYIGKNNGKVVEVTENSLMIEERVMEDNVWKKRFVTLNIKGATQLAPKK